MSNENYEVSRGSALTIDVTLCDTLGKPIIDYDGTEPLITTVWPGGGRVATFTANTLWVLPAEGTITIEIDDTITATMTPGRYQLLTRLDDGGVLVDAYFCTVDITEGPGVGLALPVYCTFADLLDSAPWLEKLQRDTDMAGFEKQRNAARKWFDNLLQRHYRGGTGLSLDFTFIPGISFGGSQGYGYRDGRRSRDLQTWLDADRLDVTDAVIEAVTCYAIALLCDRQVTPGKEDTGYADKAMDFYRQAEYAAQDITAEIDTNGDGVNDITIRLGIADTLEG